MYLANKTGDENRKAFIFKKRKTCPRLLDGAKERRGRRERGGGIIVMVMMLKTM